MPTMSTCTNCGFESIFDYCPQCGLKAGARIHLSDYEKRLEAAPREGSVHIFKDWRGVRYAYVGGITGQMYDAEVWEQTGKLEPRKAHKA